MNRELKFRVWYYDQKKFDNNLELGDFKRYSFPLYWCCVQQYTGLKDKNGKDIYEGDIVLYRKQNREVCIGEFWDGADDRVGTFLQNPEIKHRNFGTNKLSAFTSCEIIGNIFENPDLLK